MKRIAQDMLDTLVTGEDKIDKVQRMKKVLASAGYRCTVARRKLANGHKVYITVSSKKAGENLFANDHQGPIRRIIKQEFPKAIMTSGGGTSMTFAEY